ncbi:MAG: hypothetical protein AAF581_00520 [Planctomycetota bacterium]
MLKSSLAGALLSLVLCTASFAQGDGSQYEFRVNNVTGASGSQQLLTVTVESLGASALPLQGWSFGVCHNGNGIDVAQAASLDVCSPISAALQNNPGACITTQAVLDLGVIAPLFFNNISVFYAGAGFDHPGADGTCAPIPVGTFSSAANANQAIAGWSQAIVIDQNSFFNLAAGSSIVACETTVDLVGPAGTYDVEICHDTIGNPVVSAVVVEDGASLQPVYTDGSVTILSPNFVTIEAVTVTTDPQATTNVLLTNVGDIAGLQLGLTFPDADLALASATAVGPAAAACFFQQQPGTGAGELAIGLIMDYGDPTPCGQGPIPAGTDVPIIELVWDILGSAPSTLPLTLTDGLGSPPIDNKIIFPSGATETPNLVSGSVELLDFNSFVRGDCNQDGNDNIADGVFLLIRLFASGAPLTCEDACDFNDDGSLDITDAAQLFNWRLQPTSACPTMCSPPAAPYPGAGIDPTPNSVDAGDLLGCDGDADDGLSTP